MVKLPAFKLTKILAFLKWSKVIAKIVAVGTAISGAVSALTSNSVITGLMLSATGATSYVAVKTIPDKGYEKTTHIPPNFKNDSINRNVKLYNPSQMNISHTVNTTLLTGKR